MSKRARRPSPPPKTTPFVTLAAASMLIGACGGPDSKGQPPQIPPQPTPVESMPGTSSSSSAAPTAEPPQAPPVPTTSATASSTPPAASETPPQVPPKASASASSSGKKPPTKAPQVAPKK